MRIPRIGTPLFSRNVSKTHVGKSPKRLLCSSEYLPDSKPFKVSIETISAVAKSVTLNRGDAFSERVLGFSRIGFLNSTPTQPSGLIHEKETK
jgi:hypothetical protein